MPTHYYFIIFISVPNVAETIDSLAEILIFTLDVSTKIHVNLSE